MLRDYWNEAFAETTRRYGEIRTPLLLVWGGRDIWVGARCGRRLAADTGSGLTFLARAGHLAHQARPELFNEAVLCFLRSEP